MRLRLCAEIDCARNFCRANIHVNTTKCMNISCVLKVKDPQCTKFSAYEIFWIHSKFAFANFRTPLVSFAQRVGRQMSYYLTQSISLQPSTNPPCQARNYVFGLDHSHTIGAVICQKERKVLPPYDHKVTKLWQMIFAIVTDGHVFVWFCFADVCSGVPGI